jgi:hypothetical protein
LDVFVRKKIQQKNIASFAVITSGIGIGLLPIGSI